MASEIGGGVMRHRGPSTTYHFEGPADSIDGADFFDRMRSILLKQESILHAVHCELQGPIDITLPPETTDAICIPGKPNRKELDLLYEEAIYTVVNKVGVPFKTNEDELFRYLQKVFKVKAEEHDIILQSVQNLKRARFSLKVSVMKGKDLLAKDANGYSDPYCMLGILLGRNRHELEGRKERWFSIRKQKEKMDRLPSVKDRLSEKCIQVTKVKHETLYPVWNEHFVFEVDDVHCDLLHLDIWDHDDDVSVAEACKKLKEVNGLKGMGRYFKQIAKSVRNNSTSASAADEDVDDFLGCINIPINEIPFGGYDRWFKLQPRSSASKVKGECHLILKLFCTQVCERDTTLSKRDSQVTLYEKLLRQILQHEHLQKREDYSWDGGLSEPAGAVLCYHAVQTNLSALQLAVIRWRCYSMHHRAQPLCYSFLLDLMKTLEAEWEVSNVEGEMETHVAESFDLHVQHCLSLIKRLHQVFPCSNPTSITRCELMLRGLGHILTMQAFKEACPHHQEWNRETASVIKKSIVEWYRSMMSLYKLHQGTLKEQLRDLVLVVDAACAHVQRAHSVYHGLFSSSLKLDFFSISYQQLEKLVASDMQALMEKVCVTLKKDSSHITQPMWETLFELYMSLKTLQTFREFLPLKDMKTLALTGFQELFKTTIHKWLQIVYEKSCERIHKAVEAEQFDSGCSLSKHSASADHVTFCFSQVQHLWLQLAWPDSSGEFIFRVRLAEDVCSVSMLYCELIKRKIEISIQEEGNSLSTQLCIALNNIEHVCVFLENMSYVLGWQKGQEATAGAQQTDKQQQVNQAHCDHFCNTAADLQREVKCMIAHLTDKMLLDLKKCILHISLSPDSISSAEAVSPLMKYLDDTLVILSASLVKKNLRRVLNGLWWLLFKLVFDTVAENSGVSLEFYGRFHFTLEALVDFFHAEGEGLPLEDLKNEDYKALEKELWLMKCSSSELIEQYFLEKTAQQRTLRHSPYGRISVKCYYESQEERLAVEVLHASDLVALDANGLSDPFVIVELCPQHLFPTSKSRRTQVKPKTLHPVFDEVFYFHVNLQQCRHRSACVVFTVMDYDWLSANDFAGEGTVPLSDFYGLDKPGASRTMQPIVLLLTRPKPSAKPIMKMLERRTRDKEAREFVRKLKETERLTGGKGGLLNKMSPILKRGQR
ncbi:BAI1-associated protein 3-like [Brienomyrus brachyistius]|uniref:BAI1-associated protein 3-like n=1 Tax=Brienomyrus brachyistius TaxID=42636 RepID=UPI0020B1B439|nr:BAI1-associated protein 3-like [Brienomyrus brachyistius]